VVAGVLVVGAWLVAARAVTTVRRLRREGSRVAALTHDIDLPGRFPPRWLVVLGDSAAAGHGLPGPEDALPRLIGRGLVAADGRATAVRSAAEDGAWTACVLQKQVDAIAGADVVVIGVGVNDAVRPNHRVDEVAGATRALLERVLALTSPTATVVLLTCPDLSAAPGLPVLLRPALGWRCRAIAAAQAEVAAEFGVRVVGAGRGDVTPAMFGTDGFHPGPAANRAVAERVVAAIVRS
jgi:lysophospholipase L1-like esterase